MNRREFLKLGAQAGAALGLSSVGGTVGAATSAATPQKTNMRKDHRTYWAWTSINKKASTEALKLKYRGFRSRGLNGIFLEGGIDERELEIAKDSGLEIHSWMWTTNRGDAWIREHHPDWYMVSRTGKSCFDHPPYVDYYRWISPVIPGVQDYLAERVDELAKHSAISGVHLDYVRYPDVILPRALWKDYGLDQTEELPDYDFCYSDHTRAAFKKQHGRDPMEIKNPATDQEWLRFRYDSVTKLVKRLAGVAHSHHKDITAAVFPTPSQARKICRQSWNEWPLDAAFPMIYHSFYNEPVEWIGDCVRENIQSVLFPVFAGLYMPAFHSPEEFRKAIRLVYKRGGAGISMFGEVADDYWKVLEDEK